MRDARRPGPSVRVRVVERRRPDGVRRRDDRLATEEPLEVRLAWPGRPADRVGVTMRTPGQDFELAAGLLYAEGLLPPEALQTVAYCTDVRLDPDQQYNVVTVTLTRAPDRAPGARPGTVTAASSACGVCGAESIEEVLAKTGSPASCEVQPARVPVRADVLHALPDRLRQRQRVFDATGGLHAAGLFTADGELLALREDVGRHNAVDKVVGSRLLAGAPTALPVLCVSGRVGFEIVQKAVAAGVGMIAAIGAPSSLAVRLAEESGVGLAGFVSRDRLVAYAGADRITD